MKEVVKLKRLTTKIGSGATPRGGQNSYKEEGISLIRSQNVLDLAFTKDGLAFIDETQANKLGAAEVNKNDILLNITGDSIARACIVPDEILPARVNQHVSIIRAGEKIDSNYLLYYLISQKKYLLTISRVGGTRNALTKEAIENIDIRLNNNDLKVASVLAALDRKIKVNDKVNDNLEQMAKTLYEYWFVQFDFPNENGKPYKASGGEMTYNDVLMRNIPNNWVSKTVSDLCIANASQLKAVHGLPFINYLETSGITKNSITATTRFSSVDELPSRAKRIVRPNDILYSTVRPVQEHHGIIKHPIENLIVSTGFTVLSPAGKSVLNDLIYQILRSSHLVSYMQTIADSSVSSYPSINSNDILSINIPWPEDETIAIQLANKINMLNQRIATNQKQSQYLASLRDWLLPMLMNGQVNISSTIK